MKLEKGHKIILKVFLVLIIFFLVFYFIFLNKKSNDTWTAIEYKPIEKFVVEFKSFDECVAWMDSKTHYDYSTYGDYGCGKNCKTNSRNLNNSCEEILTKSVVFD